MLKNKKVLITGGAGAIGTILTKELEKENMVYIVDNLSSGQWENLNDIRCTFINADIRDNDKLKKIFCKKYDIVIHLAAHFANQNSVDFPFSDMGVNISGTLNILEMCRKQKSRFIFASSSCVYGDREEVLNERMAIKDLHTPYAISKFSGELYTKFYIKHYGVEGVILRFFNNYGPYDLPGEYRNVIPNFILKAIRNEELIITGSGNETRDFNYCSNTVSGIINSACIDYKDIYENPIFNIGSGVETKISEIANLIKSLTNSKSEIIIKERRKWDQTTKRCADIEKAKKYLKYEPKVELKDGLKRTLDWFILQDWKRF